MRLLLIGGGNMGTAMLVGWQQEKIKLHTTIIDPHPSLDLNNYGEVYPSLDALEDKTFDIIVLAIKPQTFSDVLPKLLSRIEKNTVLLSIAAGKTILSMSDFLGQDLAIIRAMPNTPALIGQGMTVAIGNANVTDAQKKSVDQLLSAIGDVVWIENEEMMHAVTAVSGSGPAYIFAMIEAMQKAGAVNGLPPQLALKLALKTVEGAALLASHSDKTPAELRQQVTSPNGTTAAALAVLQKTGEGLDELMEKAITAATRRSKDLA